MVGSALTTSLIEATRPTPLEQDQAVFQLRLRCPVESVFAMMPVIVNWGVLINSASRLALSTKDALAKFGGSWVHNFEAR